MPHSVVDRDDRNDDRQRPSGYTLGRITPTFTAQTVPPALLKSHRAATWAELVVFNGSVMFREIDPPWSATARPGLPVAIVPNREHEIEPSSDARFAVQFYDSPEIS